MSITEEDVKSGRLVYSCNCGWIDTGHANSTSPRQFVGASSLWDQITKESGPRSKTSSGFKVSYRQDMGRIIFHEFIGLGVTKSYFVKSGLALGDKESVALSIFLEVSRAFENLQGSFPWSLRTGPSSFSQEDLVSDLIGFYTVVRPKVDYIGLCKPLGTDESRKVFDNMTSSEREQKNQSPSPIFYKCAKCSSSTFPAELQKIKPAPKGKLFRDWTTTDQFGEFKIPRNFPLIIASKAGPASTIKVRSAQVSGKNPRIG